MSCISIGSTNADIAGLGVVVAFAVQGGISLVLSVLLYFLRNIEEPGVWTSWARSLAARMAIGKAGMDIYKIRRTIIDKILAAAADTQVLTGIALLLSSLIQRKTFSLYHYHVIYDTVNFTCVSFCAAVLSSFNYDGKKRISRFLAVGIFSALYLAFAIIFGLRLQNWSIMKPGFCYNTRFTATPDSQHPLVDQIYLGITCFYMFGVLIISLRIDDAIDKMNRKYKIQSTFENQLNDAKQSIPVRIEDLLTPALGAATSHFYTELLLRPWIKHLGEPHQGEAASKLAATSQIVLLLALIQYPVHMYSVFALRASNEHLLSGESENAWGFGQIVALVMLAQTIIEGCRGFKEYRSKKRFIMAAENLTSVADQMRRNSEAESLALVPPKSTRVDES